MTVRWADRRARARARAGGGFTLLEVVLAMALVVALSGLIYGFYHQALQTRDAIRQQSETLLAQRRILDVIADDLRSAAGLNLPFGLRGDNETVSLLRTVVPTPAVFYEPDALDTRRQDEPDQTAGVFGPRHDLRLVRYFLEVTEDGEIGPLRRVTLKAVMDTADDGSGRQTIVLQESDSVVLSEQIKFLYLQYRAGEEWAESWSGDGLPKAVRITLGLLPLPEDATPEEYPYETVWREVAIPAGSSQTPGGAGETPGGSGQTPGRGGGGRAGP